MAKGPIGRIADIIRADVNDVLSRMEDPKKLIGQMIVEMEDSVNETISAVGRAMGNENLIERRIKACKEEITHWEDKAQQAVAAGEDELARKALQQKLMVSTDLDPLSATREEAQTLSTQLKRQLEILKVKLQEAKSRQRAVIARHFVTRQSLTSEYPSVVRVDAFERFEELRQRVEQAEIVAELVEDVAGTRPALEAEFEKMEQIQRIEEELKRVKEKLTVAAPKKTS